MRFGVATLILAGAFCLLTGCKNSGDGLLDWHRGDGYVWAELSVPTEGKTGFLRLAAQQTGIAFFNTLSREQIKQNRILLNGSGVAVGDVDADGLTDIYFCRLNGQNALYKNLGNWKFTDVTSEAGVGCPGQFSTGTAFADLDGDNDLDLLVSSVNGGNRCFLNDGRGHFTEISENAGLPSHTGATTLALADVDGDGDLDLYLTNYKKKRAIDAFEPQELSFQQIVRKINGKLRVAPKFRDFYSLKRKGNYVFTIEHGEPDGLFLNDGTGHFKVATKEEVAFLNEDGKPVPLPKDWGLMARFQDMDLDGDPDLYVCNDFDSPDRIWINDGAGHFRAIGRLAIRKTSNSTMAVDFSDIDRDGDLDFYLVEMLSRQHQRRKTQMGNMRPTPIAIGEIANRPQYMRNTLFRNRGDNTYAEIAHFGGVEASGWSWSTAFMDVDLDGYEDILVANGHFYDAQDSDTGLLINQRLRQGVQDYRSLIFLYPDLKLRNVAFRNRGDLTFEEVGQSWGFTAKDISHGMAFGDLDNDGDLDLVTNRFEAEAGIYRNESVAPRLAVRLKGLPPNTGGVGAKIRVLGGPVPQMKEVLAGGFYLSGSQPVYTFATGGENNRVSIEVVWRNGRVSRVPDVRANRIYRIHESGAEDPTSLELTAAEPPAIFEDVSRLLQHSHHEEPFDDFARQPLLPNRLSQLGPGVAWLDLDGDGDDDLVLTSGKGGALAGYENLGTGSFKRLHRPPFDSRNSEEQTAVVGFNRNDGTATLFVAQANFESPVGQESFVMQYNFAGGNLVGKKKLFCGPSSIGPLALADIDGDADLDLFVGGRTLPGRYPEAASSRVFRNIRGTYTPDDQSSETFKSIGMVTGAVFSDYDNDHDPDLILALEWGPIKIFKNQGGSFREVTAALGLSAFTGWWNGVAMGDFDEDGRQDIIAGNWGLNSKYHYDEQHPLTLYYDDFDKNGTLDIVEAHYDAQMAELVPERGLSCMSRAMPYIRSRTPSFRKFGAANLAQILGPEVQNARKLQAATLQHTMFLNRGDHFEAVSLPAETQFSPVFAVCVGDMNSDGHEDVFLSQNFFATQVETDRNDAGLGIWLAGDGHGNFTTVSAAKSGVRVFGEQRGAALADFDEDGRVDLLVTQNGAASKLYRNVASPSGLRVRLRGSEQNKDAVGAVLRIKYSQGLGPAREIHAGSGYWSQNSPVQVFGQSGAAEAVWVRWPDGKEMQFAIPEAATDITVARDGGLTVNRAGSTN